ncbi:MAG: hypothetical protein RLZZ297_19 [Chloroflexota bacterium]|jgi:FtsH-binding integral membrane protein
METTRERLAFLGMEWSLIAGWLATILLVWMQHMVWPLLNFFDLKDSFDLVFVSLTFIFMILAGVALTATGFWLRAKPRAQTYQQRWLHGWVWCLGTAAVGLVLIYASGGVFAL